VVQKRMSGRHRHRAFHKKSLVFVDCSHLMCALRAVYRSDDADATGNLWGGTKSTRYCGHFWPIW
jgi:hypothetical protein